jgi:hypothetical protein
MSWTYSGDPNATQKDALRFLIGDTRENEPIMQDEEIQYLVAMYGSNEASLYYQLFSRAATIFARDIKRALGPQSEDPTERLKYFKEQAASYKIKMTMSGVSQPAYACEKVFKRNMHNNPPYSDV